MNVVERAKNILASPKTEWPVIAAEPADVATLYKNYIVPLAAIPAICDFIGTSVIGIAGFREPFVIGLLHTIVNYVVGLIGIYVFAVVVAKLAPRFGGREDIVRALKLVAYATTAAWVGGVFLLIPMLGILTLIAALYGLYLFYLGVPVMMESPPERSLVYTIAAIAIAFLVSIVVGAIANAIF